MLVPRGHSALYPRILPAAKTPDVPAAARHIAHEEKSGLELVRSEEKTFQIGMNSVLQSFDNFRAISSSKPELATPPEVCHHVRRLGRHFIQLDGREPREKCLPGAVRGPAPYPDWVGCHGQKMSTAKTESPTVALLSFCKTSRVQHTPIRSCRKRDVRGIQGLQSTRERRITQIVCRSLRGSGGSGSRASNPVT